MPLLRLTDASIAFGVHPLLDRAQLQLDCGERVGLVGRNGEGKSTLLKILSGELKPDSGDVWRQAGLKVALLDQAPSLPEQGTIYDAVADALGEIGHWISEYHRLSERLTGHGEADLRPLERLQYQLESHDGWRLRQRVETVLSRLGLPEDKPTAGLSGGWQRRVALAQALVLEPDVLLLDEPTNHLDLDAILWLEEHLLQFSGAILLITHDRAFLQRVATRIVDLDRGRLTSWTGTYEDFVRRKAAALEEESRHNAEFDKKLAEEETWIRQGIKARRTRNEGRVRALKKLRDERRARRERQGTARLALDQAERSGKVVMEAEGISLAFDGHPVVRDFSTTVMRGDRIGLIGPNGAGKTTLVRLLLGELPPDSGTVRLGTNLKVAYFDQLRAQLDPEQTLVEAVGGGQEWITIGEQRTHVLSYLGNFLFSPVRARSPVKTLSGGEQNRALLARLFSQPCNVLVLDEPTNDLDIETLELLEELLGDFEGTVLLVSHDRAFLDRVVTGTFVFEGEGRVAEYVGGYSDWLQQRGSAAAVASTVAPVAKAPERSRSRKKLSYREQRELEQLPAEIESLEARRAEVNGLINTPEFYRREPADVQRTLDELKRLEAQLELSFERWNELESQLAGDASAPG
ncbi:MAG: ATP-binding cassette domain-containing protein [Gammaproteobacteria bacterium]|nr:ATP-binding cassette domain-containing protein [Gammaproteobacteria bacterium]